MWLMININFNTRQRRARLRTLSTRTIVFCWKAAKVGHFRWPKFPNLRPEASHGTTLLHGSESWTWNRCHVKTPAQLQLRCLRKICGIPWKDRIPNTTVLERCEIEGIEALLINGQLRWAGHLTRMEENKIPKALFYGKLVGAQCSRGGQHKRYRDTYIDT